MQLLTTTPALWLPILVITVIFALCGPSRALLLRRKVEIEHIVATGGKARVVLIHGTFARGARWTSSGHPFLNHLIAALGPCDIYRLLWSGDNYQGARISAAESLACWALRNGPTAPLYLVGHSHGGTIAAMAATRLEGFRVTIVTLSTPFLIVQPRSASLLPRRMQDDALLFLGVCLWVLLGAMATYSADLAIAFGLAVIPTIWLLLATFGLHHRIQRVLENGVAMLRTHGETFAKASLIRPTPNSLLVLRTPGDEASGALATAHILSWFLTTVLKIIGRLASALFWVEELVGSLPRRLRQLGLLGWLILIVPALVPIAFAFGLFQPGLGYFAEAGFTIALSMMLVGEILLLLLLRAGYLAVAPALTIAAAIVNALLAIPFGLDLAIRSALIAVSAEPTPFGQWPVRLAAPGETLLAHSALYEGTIVRYAIQDFVEKTQSGSSTPQTGV